MNTCGRLTKSGKPCRQQVSPPDPACKMHITELEAAYRDGYRSGYNDGHSRGFDSGEELAKLNMKHEVRQQVEEGLRARPCIHFKLRDSRGRQLVQVELGTVAYTYAWDGDGELQIGDLVTVPGAWFLPHSGPQEATVCGLGSDYVGDISLVLGRAS